MATCHATMEEPSSVIAQQSTSLKEQAPPAQENLIAHMEVEGSGIGASSVIETKAKESKDEAAAIPQEEVTKEAATDMGEQVQSAGGLMIASEPEKTTGGEKAKLQEPNNVMSEQAPNPKQTMLTVPVANMQVQLGESSEEMKKSDVAEKAEVPTCKDEMMGASADCSHKAQKSVPDLTAKNVIRTVDASKEAAEAQHLKDSISSPAYVEMSQEVAVGSRSKAPTPMKMRSSKQEGKQGEDLMSNQVWQAMAGQTVAADYKKTAESSIVLTSVDETEEALKVTIELLITRWEA